MKPLHQTLVCLCLVTASVLVFSSPALADPYAFHVYQGPSTAVMPVNAFFGFHSEITNTGDNPDSYTMTIVSSGPENWTFSMCVGELCYAPFVTEAPIPETGTLAPGESEELIFDITTLLDEGTGSFTITIVSDSDGAVIDSWDYEVSTVSEDHALLLSPGEGVLQAGVNEFISFHPLLFNAGFTEDSYTLTMTRDIPANWTASFCVGELCYPPNLSEVRIPENDHDFIPSGEAVELAIDFTTLFDEGTGSATIEVVSNSDPSLRSTATFTITTGSVVAVGDVPTSVLGAVQAVPNPFNPKTEIRFMVGGSASQDVRIDIVDAAGRRIRTLNAGNLAPGPQSVAWDGRRDDGQAVAAGVYLASVRAGTAQRTVKMSLVK
jgi:hypothetical protein